MGIKKKGKMKVIYINNIGLKNFMKDSTLLLIRNERYHSKARAWCA